MNVLRGPREERAKRKEVIVANELCKKKIIKERHLSVAVSAGSTRGPSLSLSFFSQSHSHRWKCVTMTSVRGRMKNKTMYKSRYFGELIVYLEDVRLFNKWSMHLTGLSLSFSFFLTHFFVFSVSLDYFLLIHLCSSNSLVNVYLNN